MKCAATNTPSDRPELFDTWPWVDHLQALRRGRPHDRHDDRLRLANGRVEHPTRDLIGRRPATDEVGVLDDLHRGTEAAPDVFAERGVERDRVERLVVASHMVVEELVEERPDVEGTARRDLGQFVGLLDNRGFDLSVDTGRLDLSGDHYRGAERRGHQHEIPDDDPRPDARSDPPDGGERRPGGRGARVTRCRFAVGAVAAGAAAVGSVAAGSAFVGVVVAISVAFACRCDVVVVLLAVRLVVVTVASVHRTGARVHIGDTAG